MIGLQSHTLWLPQIAALFFLGLALLTLSACTEPPKREPETYLIGEGYSGPVYVVFGVTKGEPAADENGSRIYRIPDSGILLTQMSLNEGRITSDDLRSFYVSESGERTEIKKHLVRIPDSEEILEQDATYMVGGGIGNISAIPDLDCTTHYVSYHVGTPAEILENSKDVELIDHLLDKGITCKDIEEQDTLH